MDLCHVDEAGFAPTLPTSYSWSLRGQPRPVAYEAPQGRRVNVIAGYFTHGPQAGTLTSFSLASLPKRRGKAPVPREQQAAKHGLAAEEVGKIDSEVFLAFLWTVAGRPADAGADWRRERPVHFVVDNYSVHTSERVKLERRALATAGIHLFYLPAYSPELSRMEPQWRDIKGPGMPERSQALVGQLKQAVDLALARKAVELRHAHQGTDHLLPRTP